MISGTPRLDKLPTSEAQLARRVKRAMQDATDLDVYSMNAPTWIPGIDFSDHRSYWAHGYPAVICASPVASTTTLLPAGQLAPSESMAT